MWKGLVSVWKKLTSLLKGERGVSAPEWLILAGGAAVLAVLVSQVLYPALRNAHNVSVNRITNLTGSGF